MWQCIRTCVVQVLFLVLVTLVPGHEATVGWEYAVIIDAGSTGSRVHVFRYYTASSYNNLLPAVELPESVYKTSPGLSAYAFDPKTAARSLMPLLKFAKEKVPDDQLSRTPIQLMATAGLRMLNNGSAEAVMTEVHSLLSTSGFDFSGPNARVLSGSEEGVWGWLAINYATGALQAATLPPDVPSPSELLLGRKDAISSVAKPAAPLQGVVELGGASMQVTFMPSEQLPAGQAAQLVLPRLGADRVYSKSFDGLGVQAAMNQWAAQLASAKPAKDPCLPSGFSYNGVSGSADWGGCKAAVKKMLPLNVSCLYSSCTIGGAYLPTMDGAVFLGLDNFYYTAQALGLPTSKAISINTLDNTARKLCSKSWKAVRSYLQKQEAFQDTQSDMKTYLSRLCFSSALIVGVLKDALQLDPIKPILTASNSVPTPKGGQVEVNWCLGALLSEVLQQGGKALGHDHMVLAAPGSAAGASDKTAAVMAASFCLVLLVLTSLASYFNAGVTGSPLPPAGPSTLDIIASAVSHVVSDRFSSGGGTASDRDSSSRNKYTRMRAVSPNVYAYANGAVELSPGRPLSGSKSPGNGHNTSPGDAPAANGFIVAADWRASGSWASGGASGPARVSGSALTARQR